MQIFSSKSLKTILNLTKRQTAFQRLQSVQTQPRFMFCNISIPIPDISKSSSTIPPTNNLHHHNPGFHKKWVYFFGQGQTEGNKNMKLLLGGKGSGLAEMSNLGIPVPPGFTLVTDACPEFYNNNQELSQDILDQIDLNMKKLEALMNKKFGDDKDPLLLSIRSGAAASMPGMMDTILNLGLNATSVLAVANKTQNPRFAWDSYRRFIALFSQIVLEVDHKDFIKILDDIKTKHNLKLDCELSVEQLQEVVKQYKSLVKAKTGNDFPEEVKEQLLMSIKAVLRSWDNHRARAYRKMNNIQGLVGTAVNVQAMVFGNMGETSATGVAFSRDPSTGEKVVMGEYLINAQGEDVVAGIRTPNKISEMQKSLPECYAQFMEIVKKLENHFRDMQDVEFTIQEGKLFFLQCRNGKRSAKAGIKIAVEMAQEGLISQEEAILRVDPASITQLLHKQLDPAITKVTKPLGKGLAASPGAAEGEIVFTPELAVEKKALGIPTILVRLETSPEDIEGMDAAEGILTARGGMTSHAAVVCRGMGKPCICGLEELEIMEDDKCFKIKGQIFKQGQQISLNGSTGEVYAGKIKLVDPELNSNSFNTLMQWANQLRTLRVRTNADTPKDTEKALHFGAEGIGLIRTEHMFFKADRISTVRQMILTDNEEKKKEVLAKVQEFQKQDFLEIFRLMKGKPVTIRLLDPPLHEFLPKEEAQVDQVAKELNLTRQQLQQKIDDMHEFNPMLGFRGCRLGILYPEITQIQARAILQAAAETDTVPEIMIPLIGFQTELVDQKEIIEKISAEVNHQYNKKVDYMFGTMIEVPRAAMRANEIAKHAQFFSFGTNDLTQMTCGLSRDDSAKFLKAYLLKGLIKTDPFTCLDQEGVGQVMATAITKARLVNPNIKLGICGEHGGDPSSVEFCHRLGIHYVSCSPYRVPVAILAAGQAALKHTYGEIFKI